MIDEQTSREINAYNRRLFIKGMLTAAGAMLLVAAVCAAYAAWSGDMLFLGIAGVHAGLAIVAIVMLVIGLTKKEQ